MANPGWTVDIDLTDTCLEKEDFEKYAYINKEDDDDWIFCEKRESLFTANGDILKLEMLLESFYNWAKKKEKSLFLVDSADQYDQFDLQLVINFDSLEKVEINGNVIGKIYFKLGDAYFPRQNYEDYIMPLILNWLKTFNESKDQVELSFFNYSGAICANRHSGQPQLTFVGNKGRYYKNVAIEIEFLEKTIRKQAEKLTQIIDEKQWGLESFNELKTIL